MHITLTADNLTTVEGWVNWGHQHGLSSGRDRIVVVVEDFVIFDPPQDRDHGILRCRIHPDEPVVMTWPQVVQAEEARSGVDVTVTDLGFQYFFIDLPIDEDEDIPACPFCGQTGLPHPENILWTLDCPGCQAYYWHTEAPEGSSPEMDLYLIGEVGPLLWLPAKVMGDTDLLFRFVRALRERGDLKIVGWWAFLRKNALKLDDPANLVQQYLDTVIIDGEIAD
jgi:hypothetical protein